MVRTLGPLAVEVDGSPVALGPNQRVLLITLALERGRFITSFRLIQLLWGDSPPRSSVVTLRSHVAHLRRRLEPGRPGSDCTVLVASRVAKGTGYALAISPDQTDVFRFERLVDDARCALSLDRPRIAIAQVDEALTLQRGPFLADVAHRSFARPEIARLEGLRQEALRLRLLAMLACGRNREAVGQLQGLVMDAPYDEGLRELLAIALYTDQRADDAAQACQEGLRAMRDRGLDSPALQRLQLDILRRSPALLALPKPSELSAAR
ncbi:MAG: AfsR/SARP family transcriptional regulator [Actinocatenispora sp.]